MAVESSPTSDTSAARPRNANLRVLLVATAGLVGCRILSAWHSGIAAAAALAILGALALRWARTKPWLRRGLFYTALPLAVLGNAGVLAVTAFMGWLGMQGLSPYGNVAGQVPWTAVFLCVPLAAAVNLVACARPPEVPRRLSLWAAAAANLAATGYAAWFWQAIPPGFILALLGVMLLSLLAIACDAPGVAVAATAVEDQPLAHRRNWRVAWVLVCAALICVPLWIGLAPAYRNRVRQHALETLGFGVTLDVAFGLPQLDPYLRPLWQYLGAPAAAAAMKLNAEDVPEAARLLSEMPGIRWLAVDTVPSGGQRFLEPLVGRINPMQISLGGRGATDATLADAARFPSLMAAMFPNAQITDDGLAHLSGLTMLQYLGLNGTPISGAGLVHLQSLPRLCMLDLSATPLEDDELRHLQSYLVLSALNLSGTPVTDAGLAHLAGCKRLITLDLRQTQVTAAAVARLKTALPACRIEWDSP